MNSITVRYVVIWTRSRDSYSATISLDDGSNPDFSGTVFDEPIINTDPTHYEFISQELSEIYLNDTGTISGSWTITYRDFQYLNPDDEPRIRYAYGSIHFVVPSYESLIHEENN